MKEPIRQALTEILPAGKQEEIVSILRYGKRGTAAAATGRVFA